MPAPSARIRFVLPLLLLAAMVGNLALPATSARAAGTAVTTDSLNLRVGFLPTSRVKLVMPEGATVEIVNRSQNGYWKVIYQGVRGYAHGDYLDFDGGSSNGGGSSGGGATGSARTTSSLNLRAGPSTSDRVLAVMPSGAAITLTGETANGFLALTYQGTSGWASADYISTEGGAPTNPGSGNAGTAYTTSSLNLRAEPSTGVRVLLVIPSGAAVTLTGSTQNGFSGVTYQGTTGWAYSDYLGASPGAPSNPGSGNAGVAYTTSSLNLRAEPSTGVRVLLVIPSGAQVTLTGSTQNGFSGVTYSGATGWAYSQYLSSDPGSSGGGGGGGSSTIVWPFESGGSWTIIQGYNGGTHNGATYQYSLDLQKTSGGTAGTSILSPVSGTVLWNDVSSGGLAIDIGNGLTLCLFHVTFDSSLGRGDSVSQGQWLGTISAPGGAGYAATPHVDLTLWSTGRISTPFSGANAISGTSFPAGTSYNLHGGTIIYP